MDSTENRYSLEYVELVKELAVIKTNVQNIETFLRSIHSDVAALESNVHRNESDLTSLKTWAAVVGGVAGALGAALLKLIPAGFH